MAANLHLLSCSTGMASREEPLEYIAPMYPQAAMVAVVGLSKGVRAECNWEKNTDSSCRTIMAKPVGESRKSYSDAHIASHTVQGSQQATPRPAEQ